MRRIALHALTGAALVAGLTGQSAPPTTVDTHESMVRWVNPAAQAIWEVGNGAMSETGALDPALMDDEAWSKLQGAAHVLGRHSREMADAHALRVGAHDDTLEGFATRAEIQALIDADPDGFRRMSRDMAEQAEGLAAAAMARNAEQSGGLIGSLGDRCQACHSRYWEGPVQ
jgi:hypothetical protein